ncbi:MAG: acyl-CoA thioesterase/BAAT N-terminal domain-containing protein [Candidatus Eremiobacteraeota bacterium]|nr:acyl-CoA thioesterase/BAAT N-terminal domain-containing protein [Candidatus Eremiobacteraeota bacterium]
MLSPFVFAVLAHSSTTKISVSPSVALYDRPVAIHIHAPPQKEVVLTAQTTDGEGRQWSSHASFTSASGNIDLTQDAPSFGSYAGADGMGLFWSMHSSGNRPFAQPSGFKPMHITLRVSIAGKVVARVAATRLAVLPGVTRTEVNTASVKGVLFTPPGGGGRAGVIVLGGSEGGLDENDAALLASHGFVTFAAAYFGISQLPKNLVDIPVETVLGAVKYLAMQPRVGSVGIFGTSRGGELSLLAGSLSMQLKAVVAIVPSPVIEPGLRFGVGPVNESPWTYRGKPFPFASFAQLLTFLKTGDVAPIQNALIPVERINGPVLLVAASDDQLGYSGPLASLAFDQLQRSHHGFPDELLPNPGAGHLLAAPYLPTANLRSLQTPYGTLTFGGSAAAYERADATSWPKILAFLNRSLAIK